MDRFCSSGCRRSVSAVELVLERNELSEHVKTIIGGGSLPLTVFSAELRSAAAAGLLVGGNVRGEEFVGREFYAAEKLTGIFGA